MFQKAKKLSFLTVEVNLHNAAVKLVLLLDGKIVGIEDGLNARHKIHGFVEIASLDAEIRNVNIKHLAETLQSIQRKRTLAAFNI